MGANTGRINSAWVDNAVLVCLAPEIMTTWEPTLMPCIASDTEARLPLSLTVLLQERGVQNGLGKEFSDYCEFDLGLPYQTQRLAYGLVLEERLNEGVWPDLTRCPERLPTSQYMFAQTQVEQATERPERLVANLELAYLLDRGWSRAFWRAVNAKDLGQIYSEQSRWLEAIAAYERALASYLSEPMLSPNYKAEIYWSLANLYGKESEIEKATEAWLNSLLFYETLPAAFINDLAVFLVDVPQSEAQLNEISTAVAERNDPALAFRLVTVVLRQENQPAELGQQLVNAFQPVTPQGYVWAMQGAIARQQQEFGDAQEAFQKAITSGDINDDLVLAELYARLAVVFILDGQWGAGIDAQETAVSLNPQNANAWYDLATFYQQHGDLAQAYTAVQEALSLQPTNATFQAFAEALTK